MGRDGYRKKFLACRLLYVTFTDRIRVVSSATYSGQWPREKAAIHRSRFTVHCPERSAGERHFSAARACDRAFAGESHRRRRRICYSDEKKKYRLEGD